MTDNPTPPPPGYYDDGTGQRRYWDGQNWGQIVPPQPAQPSVSTEQGSGPAYVDTPQQQAAPTSAAIATASGQPPKRRGFGTWALVLGIVGVIFALIPHLSGLGIFLGIVALLIGGIGLALKRSGTMAGVILGAAALLLGIIFVGVYNLGSTITPTSPAANVAVPSPTGTSAATKVESAKPVAPVGTAAQLQALTAAKGYLADGQGFSEAGLLQQLSSSFGSGFAVPDAQWAIDHSGADWNAQALTAAKGYLADGQGFSQAGLLQQLTSSSGAQFTQDQAQYAVNNAGADWNAQAVESAKGYMSDGQGFSRDSLVEQLTSPNGEQFTEDQAEYAATQVGLS